MRSSSTLLPWIRTLPFTVFVRFYQQLVCLLFLYVRGGGGGGAVLTRTRRSALWLLLTLQ